MIELTLIDVVVLILAGYVMRICIEEMGDHSELQDR